MRQIMDNASPNIKPDSAASMASENIEKPKKTGRHYVWTAVKILLWTAMAVVLYTLGILMGVVNILTPERLTPLTERIATQSLQNCKVEIEQVELTVMKSFPFVNARIDNLTVLSTIRTKLDEETNEYLPSYTDTVITVRGFEGGLNVMKLLHNQLELSDVTIEHPSANLVIIDEEHTNFDIVPPSPPDAEPFDWNNVPGISLKRFVITDPGKLRFYNYETETELTAAFTQIDLDGSNKPYYKLNFDGNIEAPTEFYELFNIPDLNFGLNGSMKWSQKNPYKLSLENFDVAFSIIGMNINTDLDFESGVVINSLDAKFKPLNVIQVLNMIPEDLAEEFGIPSSSDFSTDASVWLTYRLDSPWNIGEDKIAPFTMTADIPKCFFDGYGFTTDSFNANCVFKLNAPWDIENSLPDMSADIKIAPMEMMWNRFPVKDFETDMHIDLPDGDLYSAVIRINKLTASGPATRLNVKGTLKDILTDPTFDGDVDCDTDLSKLPESLMEMIDGSLTGNLTAQVGIKASQSMLDLANFHRMHVTGDIALNKLYWISSDTINMLDVNRALFNFGTTEKFVYEGQVKADSLMRFSLNVDTGLVLHSDLSMNFSRLNLNLAAQNTAESSKEGRINPMGGRVSLGTFNLLKTNDSTVVKLRDLNGMTTIMAHNNDFKTPEFIFDLDVKRIATGDRENRILINNAHTRIDAIRVAKNKRAREFTHIADSIHTAMPHLSPDSVIYYALQIHNRGPHSPYPRVHEVYNRADSMNMMDWGASPMFKRILNLWTFSGTLTSSRAGLFTPYLPLRNRLKHIDISFNNDSVSISNLEYKIGHTDFTVNGVISNMRKAFTSTTGKQPLRINFETLSDTIDINQLTEALILGSTYSSIPEHLRKSGMAEIDADEESLEEHIARITQNAPDTIMPILIPENLDAEFSLKANNVIYSDFDLKKMTGKVLAYGGALNLQDLSASSSVGSLSLSALYSGLHPDQLRFGFGLKLHDFNLHKFLRLVPAVDSVLPVMKDLSGIIDVNIAATSDVDRHMNLVLPSLDAAIDIQGDSIVLLSPDTFKSLAKWLLFRDKNRNIIDKMNVQMMVHDNQIDVYPFIFDFDRYKLGVQGYNDFDLNFNYHVAVLKSPIPFKFGINISGNPDKYKIRLGGAKFKENSVVQLAVVDTARVNLMKEINNVFKRGAREGRLARLKRENKPLAAQIDLNVDTLTHADSLLFIQEGLIDAPPVPVQKEKSRKNKKSKAIANGDTQANAEIAILMAVLSPGKRKRRHLKRHS